MEEIFEMESLLDKKYGRNPQKYLGSPEYKTLQKLIAEKQKWCYANNVSYYELYVREKNG